MAPAPRNQHALYDGLRLPVLQGFDLWLRIDRAKFPPRRALLVDAMEDSLRVEMGQAESAVDGVAQLYAQGQPQPEALNGRLLGQSDTPSALYTPRGDGLPARAGTPPLGGGVSGSAPGRAEVQPGRGVRLEPHRAVVQLGHAAGERVDETVVVQAQPVQDVGGDPGHAPGDVVRPQERAVGVAPHDEEHAAIVSASRRARTPGSTLPFTSLIRGRAA